MSNNNMSELSFESFATLIREQFSLMAKTCKLEPTTKQLAGLGFTDDSKETLIVKVEGTYKKNIV